MAPKSPPSPQEQLGAEIAFYGLDAQVAEAEREWRNAPRDKKAVAKGKLDALKRARDTVGNQVKQHQEERE